MSSTIASSILRKFSACRSSLDENGMAPILVTPSTTWAISGAEQLGDALRGGQGVLDDVVEQPGGDRDHVQLHVGEEIGHFERVDEVGLPRMADLSLVLERREDVRPPEQLEVGIRAVAPHFLEERLESNHENRCLTSRTGGSSRAVSAALGPRWVHEVCHGANFHDSRTLDCPENRSLYWRACGARGGPMRLGPAAMC